MNSPFVTHEDYGTEVPRRFLLHAFLAEKAGFEPGFTLYTGELEGEEDYLVDAECQHVPSLQELCLRKPFLIGPALEWLADNQ